MDKSLFDRFDTLRRKVGGYWDKQEFVHTMEKTPAEENRITPPSGWITRILSEIQFVLQEDKVYGLGEKEAAQAISVLEEAMAEDGVLTNSACKKAEACLMPLAEESKSYQVLYVAHAHIDMNWQWGWQETVAITLSTFRTMLNLMNEYPDFTFAQSQASVYRIVEQYDPEMMEEIRQRIREGRWEVTANAWVETDKNMPDTESLLHHISVTREYLEKHWGIEAGSVKVDFSPDTFGHSRFVPEINNLAKVPYYYHCRGLQDDLTLYRFRAPSGQELLVYKEPYWYNSGVNPENGIGAPVLSQRCQGLKTSMVVYGVGDHGGGATRRDVERMLEMQAWPVFPTLRFGRMEALFEAAEAVREKLPVIDHELNSIFTGCYTTQSRIKRANRQTERTFANARKWSAMAKIALDKPYPYDRFEEAWENLLFTHFHDILTGSCVQDSREYAMGRLSEAMARAQSGESKALENITRNIDTTALMPQDEADPDSFGSAAFLSGSSLSEGAGAGFGLSGFAGVPNPERGKGRTRLYTLFNSTSESALRLYEITLWDYPGTLNRLAVTDEAGNALSFSLEDKEPVWYWTHTYVRLLVRAQVPANGYAICRISEKKAEDAPAFLLYAEREELPNGRIVLENAKLKAQFDTGSGLLYSLIDKRTGREMLSAPAGLHLVRTEDAGMSAWRIGRFLGMDPVTNTTKVTFSEGSLRQSVTFEQKVLGSSLSMTVSLDPDASALRYDLKVDWNETAALYPYLPLLSYRLPLAGSEEQFVCDVPAGFVTRKASEMDVPALTGAYVPIDGDRAAALITDCKYGYRYSESVLSCSLIHTAHDPDPYPERGIHTISLFVALTDASPSVYKALSESLLQSAPAISTGFHAGTLPMHQSFYQLDAAHTCLSGISCAEDGSVRIRLYEAEGAAETCRLMLPKEPKEAFETDLSGKAEALLTIEGKTVVFKIDPYRLTQIKVIF